MKNTEINMSKRAGFTIVELLTVMAVIAILIGLLVPALSLVHDTAKDLQQRAQFHGLEVGLELYKTQFGNYPESNDNQYDAAPGIVYAGANKLAETMVGYDLLGFNPFSELKADGQGPDPLGGGGLVDLYDGNFIDKREERFIDLEKANAYMLGDIYDTVTGFNASYDNFVLCDSYAKRREVSGKKTGMPVLYYRADTKYKIQDSTLALVNNVPPTIYNYRDNESILLLGAPDNSGFIHDLAYAFDPDNFDLAIINEQVQVAAFEVPYRAQSFILISAGKDGVYGTEDDIQNFGKQK